jgi:hypothetical protein
LSHTRLAEELRSRPGNGTFGEWLLQPKNHIGCRHDKLIRKVTVTNVVVANTCAFEDLLDPNNSNGDGYADCGDPSAMPYRLDRQYGGPD